MEIKKKTNWFKNSISFKLIVITVISLLLLIPSAMIKDLIRERKYRKTEVTEEIAGLWGNNQTIKGPILEVPYTFSYLNADKKRIYKKSYLYVIPDELKIEGTLEPEERKRGIYNANAYKSKLNIQGFFSAITKEQFPENCETVDFNRAKLLVGINDLRGIDSEIQIQLNNTQLLSSPGTSRCKALSGGFQTKREINAANKNQFKISIDLNGSKHIQFTPISKNNTVILSSDWEHPKFFGAFIPDTHSINENGFNARWNVLEMNREIPLNWTNSDNYVYDNLNSYLFGVELIDPVDNYLKSERSVKYALLFIALTFLIIFFKEIINKERIHPIQYLIIGIAVVIFYSVLLALSEHIGFNAAYIVSSIIIISMISFYASTLFRKKAGAIVLSLILILMYSFLFVVLQIADFALLLGNVGILIALGLIMFFSKRIDWYGERNGE